MAPHQDTLQAVEIPGTKRTGQTGIYRRAGYEAALLHTPPSRPNVRTVYDAFQNGLRESANGPCLGRRPFNPATNSLGDYEWQTYTEVNDRITRFGSGIGHLHQQVHGLSEIAQRFAVGLWSINRAEWTIASEAGSAYNFVSVGLYDTLGPEAVAFGINHSECSIVVTSMDHIATLLNQADKLPVLKAIISMDSLESGKAFPGTTAPGTVLRTYAQDKGIQLYDWQEIETLGTLHGRKHTPAAPADLYTICYTSGTTGLPKGAMISHQNVVSVLASADVTMPMSSQDRVISFLPLPHIFGRVMEIFMFAIGGQIGYSCGDQLLLLDDIAHLKPTLFPAVPRLLNRVYAKVYASTAGAPGLVGALARKGLAVKLANLKAGKGFTHPLWDRLLFSKVRQALGGNVRLILTASAPISAEILGFLRVAFCTAVIEAYGQTENTGAATNTSSEEKEAGHVGPPNACAEIKLVDVPSLNYYATDKPYPRGEICVRGPSIFPGYLKDEEKTRETIDEEGFLHSGDVGIIGKDNCIYVIDRVKNVFKLSQGEYVAAEKIENCIASRLPFVQQFFVHGDSTENCLVAILVPEPDEFVPFVNRVLHNVNLKLGDTPLTFQKVCSDPKLRQIILAELVRAGKDAGLKGFEIPKAVMIENVAFSVENGKLTPTFKIKRHPVVQEYRAQLTALYQEIHQHDAKL